MWREKKVKSEYRCRLLGGGTRAWRRHGWFWRLMPLFSARWQWKLGDWISTEIRRE